MRNLLPTLLAAAGIFLAGPVSAQDVVKLGNLKFAHYGAVSYMKELGPKYNLKIEERVFAKGVDIIPGIIAGEVDLAASAADGAIAGRAAGCPVFVVAGFARGGIRIVVRPDLPIKGIADLKGKKVGVARGGAQELALLAELSKFNLTWSDKGDKDVQIIYLAYADLNGALSQKSIDVMCQSEPQSSQAIAKGWGRELLKPYDTEMGEPVRALVMTEKVYANRDLASRILKCFVEATKLFIDKPDLAEKYVREQMFKGQITPEEYHDAIANSPFTYDITVEHIQITTDFMVKFGVAKLDQGSSKAPRAVDWVKTDLLTEAKKTIGAK